MEFDRWKDSVKRIFNFQAIEPVEHHGSNFKYVVSWKIFGADTADDDDDTDEEETQTEEDDNKGWSRLVIEDWEQVIHFA